MLRISRIADYGVVLGTRLATVPYEDVRSVRDLARETGIPQPTVSKILKQLAREGVLDSTRGARGGYRLARRPENVTVAEIVAALEGPIGVTECWRDEDDDCELSGRCRVRGNWQRINQAIAQALAGITLAHMAEPPQRLVTIGSSGHGPRPEEGAALASEVDGALPVSPGTCECGARVKGEPAVKARSASHAVAPTHASREGESEASTVAGRASAPIRAAQRGAP